MDPQRRRHRLFLRHEVLLHQIFPKELEQIIVNVFVLEIVHDMWYMVILLYNRVLYMQNMAVQKKKSLVVV